MFYLFFIATTVFYPGILPSLSKQNYIPLSPNTKLISFFFLS